MLRPNNCPLGGRAAIALLSLTGLACGGPSSIDATAKAEPTLFLIRDLVPGPSSTPFGTFASDGIEAFFKHGGEIWRTQGSDSSTQRFTRLPDSVQFDSGFVKAPGFLLIGGSSSTAGYEPWLVNETSATLLDVNPDPPNSIEVTGSSYPQLVTVVGSRMFFVACEGSGHYLFVTDGTASGTRRLAGPFDGRNNSGGKPCLSFLNIWTPTAFQGKLFFLASSPENGQGLWSSDGTPEGTKQVFQSDPNPHDGTPVGRFIPPPAVAELVVVGGRMYFRNSRDLWSSDGTSSGTVPMTSEGVFPTDLVASATRLFFLNVQGIWTSDGSRGGTRFLSSVRYSLQGTTSPNPDLFATGDTFYFGGINSPAAYDPWACDGVTARCELLSDIRPGIESSWPTDFAVVGSTVYFSAYDGAGRYIWASDGTPSGTRRLGGQTAPTIVGGVGPALTRFIVRVRDGLVFAGKDSEHGTELWGIRTP